MPDKVLRGLDAQPKGLDIGIYFGLDEFTYHNDPAISASDMKFLLEEGPGEFWSRKYGNGRKVWAPTDEQKEGTRLHRLLLEPDTFRERYAIIPGDKLENGKEWVTAQEFKRFNEMVEVIRTETDSARYITNGFAEVSIFWQCPVTGLRLKARHDYFRTMLTMDYKTIRSVKNSVVKSNLNQFGYDIQNAHYFESRRWIKQFLAEIRQQDKENGTDNLNEYIYADEDSGVTSEWIQRMIDEEFDDFYFIFQKKTPGYSAFIIRLDDQSLQRGADDMMQARKTILHFLTERGTEPWPRVNAKPVDFSTWYGSQDSGF